LRCIDADDAPPIRHVYVDGQNIGILCSNEVVDGAVGSCGFVARFIGKRASHVPSQFAKHSKVASQGTGVVIGYDADMVID
jgi:hypothetical protein